MPGDFFIKFDGIEGESKDSVYKGYIEIDSLSFGTAATAGTGVGPGQTKIVDFHVTMKISKASPRLFMCCATGASIAQAILCARKAGSGQQEYARWTFSNVLITSYTTSAHGASEQIPTEAVTCSYETLETQYREQRADGSLGPPVKASFDAKTGQAK